MGEIPISAERIWTYTLGELPGAVSRFADKYGFPPFWHRWSGGTISKEMVDCENGEASWTVKPGEKGQVCWLHWSDRMFPDGIELTIEPSDAVKVGALNNRNETAQFTFNSTDEIKISLSPGNGRGPSDVSVDGKAASKVKGGSGAVAGGAAAAGAAAGAGAAAAASKKSKKNGRAPPPPAEEEEEEEEEQAPPPPKATSGGRGQRPGRRADKGLEKEAVSGQVGNIEEHKLTSFSPLRSLRSLRLQPTPPPAAEKSTETKAPSGQSDFLVLNDSLKFSAGQVVTVAGVAGLCYLLGKLSTG